MCIMVAELLCKVAVSMICKLDISACGGGEYQITKPATHNPPPISAKASPLEIPEKVLDIKNI